MRWLVVVVFFLVGCSAPVPFVGPTPSVDHGDRLSLEHSGMSPLMRRHLELWMALWVSV